MKKAELVSEIISRLEQAYPDALCSLTYEQPHELMIAGRLSAQCTDARVNIVTKELFAKYKSIEDFANALRMIIEGGASTSSPHIIDIEDREILKAVEYYSDKSHCTLFRGKTNIDFNNKLITFNLSKLGKDLKTLAMEVICDTIWLKICKNRDAGIPTDLIIDEFHLMFKSVETASWMAKYWKQLRKYKGCPVGITQNPEDLLSSEDGRKVVANTNMNILLSMLEKDREIIKDTLNLTYEEIKYIRNKKAGEGILVIGAGKKLNNQTTIPFRNHYEKDNIIYALINTSDDAIIKGTSKKY